MKHRKKTVRQRLLPLLITICLVTGLIPGIALEAHAATVHTFGGDAIDGSLRFKVADNGKVGDVPTSDPQGGIAQYRNGAFTGQYCTVPDTKWWVDGVGHWVTGTFNSTTGGSGSILGNATSSVLTTSGDTETLTQTWIKGNLTFSHVISYTKGASYFDHTWGIENNTGQDLKHVTLYQGGHHQLGGSSAGWGNYIGLTDMAYTWMNAESGMTYLRGTGGSNADSSSHFYAYYVSQTGAPQVTKIPYKYNMPDYVSADFGSGSTHAGYYLQWDIASEETTSPAYGRTVPAGESYFITAQEGIAPSGNLMIIPDGDIRAPQGATIPHTFTLYNISAQTLSVDLSLDNYTWDSWFDGLLIGQSTTVTVPASGSTLVTVYVTIPPDAAEDEMDNVTLDANYVYSSKSYTASESANTIADSTTPYISTVNATNSRERLDVEVHYENLNGANLTSVEIFDSTGASVVATVPIASDTIISGGKIENIDVSALPEGTYTLRVVVQGIAFPHNTTTFTLTDSGIVAYTWRDMNANGTRDTFEGVRNIDVTVVPVNPSGSFETKPTEAGGLVILDTPIANGAEYGVYPTLDPYEYALTGITAVAETSTGMVNYTSDITASDNDPIFEYLDFSATVYGSPGVQYKYRTGTKTPVTFNFELTLAAVVEVYPHTGSTPDPANYVTGGEANLLYSTSGGTFNPSSGVMATVPYIESVAAGSSPLITYSAPYGYRHAAGSVITDSQTLNNLAAYAYRNLPYDVNFPLVAGDLRLTGVSAMSGTPTRAAITNGLSGNGNTATLAVPIVEVDTNWAGVNAQLDFSVWDSSGNQTVNPANRSSYTWTLVNDPNDIIQSGSFINTAGTLTFTGVAGEAEVRVRDNTSSMFHDMIIEVSAGAPVVYSDLYIAKASDTSLARVTDLALLVGETEELVVVGEDSSNVKYKLLNSEASLVSGSGSVASVTATPSATSLYNFILKGESQGTTVLTASESGGLTANANVLVTSTGLNGAGLTITPDPVNLTSGAGTAQVAYGLRFANNSTMAIGPEFVTPSVSDPTIAAVSSTGNNYLNYVGDGTTTLNAFLNVAPAVTGSTGVISASGGTTVTPQGTLRLAEAAGSTTGGIIEAGSTAEYFAYFDVNNDGVYDAGDVLLPFGTAGVTFSAANGRFTTGGGVLSADNVELTGVSAGVDELKVTYVHSGTTYTASADILVHDTGYTLSGLEVTPEITVLHVGDMQTYVVKALFSDGSNTVSYVLPESMYSGSMSTAGTYASLVYGTENQVRALAATGTETYRATLNSDTSRTAEGEILVIPVGAYLRVSPDPLWVEAGATGTVTYELRDQSETVIAVSNLADYVSAGVGSQSVATFKTVSGVDDITQVDGVTAGRTTLTAYLHGQTVIETITLYVWDDTSTGGVSGIAWNPDPLTIGAGYTGLSSVYLLDSAGNRAAMVDLEHLAGLTSADSSIASIPASPTGTALTVRGGAVTVNSSTTVDATCQAGSADLDVNVATGTTISGLAATPAVIELWPGETKEITVTNTATGLSLDAAQLAALGQSLTDLGGTTTTENDVTVNSSGTALEASQAGSGVATASVNLLTLTMGSETAEVYIINHTQDPYQNGYTRTLELDPDPSWVALGSANSSTDVAAVLTLTDSSSAIVDAVTLPANLVSWEANTTSSLPGRIAMAASASITDTVTLTGQTAGAQTYRVTYSSGVTPLVAEGRVFVYARDTAAIDFKLEPAAVALRPNGTQSIRGVITYTNGSIQYITAQELAIALPDLDSNDPTTAAYSTGVIRGQSLGSDPVRFTSVDGTLVGTGLPGHVDVMVYDPNAQMVIEPDDILIWTPGGTSAQPNIENIVTKIGSVNIPNVFLEYSTLHNNISLTPDSLLDDEYTVTGVSVGTTTITSLLVNTTRTATAQAEVRDPNLSYYVVDYDANVNGTGAMNTFTVASGGTHIAQPNGFTPDSGYYFDGWNTQNDGLGVDYDVDDPITITGDLTLYAKWTTVPPGNYTVTFDGNGGTGGMTPDHGAPGTTYTVPASTFSEPANSQFKEWNTAADGSGTGYQPGDTFPLHSDVTLYAIWDDLYTVSYDATSASGSGTGAMSPDTDVAGSTYTVRTNEFTPPANMRFVEWNTQADGLGTSYAEGATFTLTADVDLYAIWEPAPVVPDRTVSYHAASSSGTGTGMMTPDLVPDGSVYSVRGNTFTAPSGMQFREWNTAANGSGTAYAAGATMTVTADVDLYAVWEPLLPTVNHTVSYHAASSSGTGSGTMSQDVAPSGSTYTVRSSTFTAPTGMQFKEWNTAANGSGTTYAAGATFTLTADTDLYAIWEAVPAVPEYTVSYSSNGGSGSMSADTASTGFVYTVRANGFTAPAGKRFVEWNTASDGSGTAYQPNATFALSADVTLYAIWEDLYTVAYDANGGSGVMGGHTVSSGATHRAQPSGFTAAGGSYFDGWNTAADGTGTAYSVGDPITVTANVTLYAQWTVTPPASYNVIYDGNGATGAMPGDTDTPGATYTVQGNGYTDPSWTRFKEWNTAPDGSGTSYNPADTLTLNSDVILYAVWENIYSVTYDDNSADSGAAPTDATIYIDGETVTVSDNTGSLVKAGCVFRGWALNSAGTGQIYAPGGTYTIDGAAVSSGTVTFYAVWDDASSPSLYRLTVQAGSGGSVNSSAGGYYRVGDTVSITATPDSGYTFGSWTVTGGATLTSSGSASTTLTMAAADATATAGFSQTDSGRPGGGSGGGSSTYSITYKANGGTGSDHRVTDLASNASHTVLSRTAVDFSRSGYTFTGWNTKADGSGTSYSVGDVINVTASLTLYAQWTEAGGSDLSGILNTDDHIAYLSGYTDNTVRADNPITRAEAAAIFYRLLRNPGTSSGNGFSDVQSGEWYAQAVNYLASIDILDGYNDGTFRPNASITRAEFATMASRFDNLQAGGSNVFSDVSDGHWAASYISLAYSNGWINGYNDGTFRPDNSITRAEVVTIVNAMLDRSIDDVALTQVSNPYNDIQAGHWAYAAVIEASTAHEYERDGDGVEIWQSW